MAPVGCGLAGLARRGSGPAAIRFVLVLRTLDVPHGEMYGFGGLGLGRACVVGEELLGLVGAPVVGRVGIALPLEVAVLVGSRLSGLARLA